MAESEPDTPAHEPLTDAQRALRAQMLATEHWGLLAARSTTQSEVLTRIAIFLTLVSAGLITLSVIGQASDFRGWFAVAALGIEFMLMLLGVLTLLRVFNVGSEDLAYVIAMNRLRGAYVDLDPGVGEYLLLSPYDDERGSHVTYHFLDPDRRTHVAASSMTLITVVVGALSGLFTGSLGVALGAAVGPAVAVGAVVAILFVVLTFWWGYRVYLASWTNHRPRRRSPGSAGASLGP